MADVIVRLGECADSGEISVPAGARIVVAVGWAAKNRGLVQNFLQAQTTTLRFDGGDPVDVSDSYGAIEEVQLDGGAFAARLLFDTGVTLSAGQSLEVDDELTFSHAVVDGLQMTDENTHRPHIFRPEEPLTLHCRITAAA
jgi:hypothetical protein